MALARIITRSQTCSRELAIQLLARGYAVEIVSPDSVPDNIADLELRVEEDPGNQLVASVEAHDGARSASLDFVHHLKAPMADFTRRVPEPMELVYLSGGPASFDTGPSVEPVELPAEASQPAPKAVAPAVPILRDLKPREPSLDDSSRQSGVRSLSLLDRQPSRPTQPATEPPIHLAKEAPPIAPPVIVPVVMPTTIVPPAVVQARRQPSRRARSAAWQWRAALTFASTVCLALALGFGVRRIGGAPPQISGVTSAEKIAVSPSDEDLLAVAAFEKNPQKGANVSSQVSNAAVSPPARKSGRRSHRAPKESPVAGAGAAVINAAVIDKSIIDKTTVSKTGASSRHRNELIAHDTVTYLDSRYQPAPKASTGKRVGRLHSSPHKRSGGVVAANSVTLLNKTPDTKATK